MPCRASSIQESTAIGKQRRETLLNIWMGGSEDDGSLLETSALAENVHKKLQIVLIVETQARRL